MKVLDVREETVNGVLSTVTTVESEKGIGIAYMPILDAEGQARREERIREAFAELIRGCIRERGEEWVRERLK